MRAVRDQIQGNFFHSPDASLRAELAFAGRILLSTESAILKAEPSLTWPRGFY